MVVETLFEEMHRVFCVRAEDGLYTEAFVQGGYVGLGWLEGIPLSESEDNEDSIRVVLREEYPDESNGTIGQWVPLISCFLREIRPGDWVLTPDRDRSRIYIGKVVSNYFYEENTSAESPYPHRRQVEWCLEPVQRTMLPEAWQRQMYRPPTVFRVDSVDDDDAVRGMGPSMAIVNERPYWFVGADLTDGDQTDRFLRDGIWEVDFEPGHRYTDKINSMQPGDRIAIKSSFRRRRNLPFPSDGRDISTMRIKAVGTVTENMGDGQRVKVDWSPRNDREWHFYTSRNTVWEVWSGQGAWPWAADQLIRFAFEGVQPDYARFLKAWGIGENGEEEEEEDGEETYEPAPHLDLAGLARNLYFPDASHLRDIELLLEEKKQVIFYGPPGTGKTYVARELAKHLADGTEGRVTLVQFHPSYAYEDFVQGYRPISVSGQVSYEIKPGPLMNAADAARGEPDAKHYLVIDEINRGNLAKVFGELYFLLEYRAERARLLYSDRQFSLPTNLYIIGTMNTADRNIALVDLALRRRFYFVEFHPSKEPVDGVLRRYLDKHAADMEWVADVVDEANKRLAAEGRNAADAAIGPSYFMQPNLDDAAVERIWKHSVLPYIEERLFGESDVAATFALATLRSEVE